MSLGTQQCPLGKVCLQKIKSGKLFIFIYEKSKKLSSTTTQHVSEPSLENGGKVYSENCSVCHGEKGAGDGPGAKVSSPFPKKFTLRGISNFVQHLRQDPNR